MLKKLRQTAKYKKMLALWTTQVCHGERPEAEK
jgi:hypothetical protein